MTHLPIEKNIYRIDRNDRLVTLGGDWDLTAATNDAPELTAQKVINLSLWDFVSGEMLLHVYRQVLILVRTGKSFQFDLRCDSPDTRRFLELRITPEPDGGVLFETVVNRAEVREPQEILRRPAAEGGEIVTTCSWCQKIKTGEDTWHEVEEAVQILCLFDLDPPPQLSHGMCLTCFDTAMREVADKTN